MNSKHLPNLVKSACYVELLGGQLISINSNFFIATLLQKIKQSQKRHRDLQKIWHFNGGIIAWENSQWIFQWYLLFPREITSEDREQKFPADERVVVLIGWKFASDNQKHYPDLGSDASSVWNFCTCFSDVISRGNWWWCRGMLVVFSGWRNHSCRVIICLLSNTGCTVMLSIWFWHKITSCLGIVVFLISLLNYPTFIDPTSRWKWLSTRDSILPLCSDELWCKGKLKQYWVTDRLATSNLAKRRSFALRSTFIFIRKILSVWMFSVEVGREETGGAGGSATPSATYCWKYLHRSQLLVVRVIFSSSFLFSLVKSRQSLSILIMASNLFSKCSAFFQWRIQTLRWGGRGGAVSQKNFWPFGPQFGLKIRGELGPPGPSPGIFHCVFTVPCSGYDGVNKQKF